MPVIPLVLLFIVLVAAFGFWDSLAAVLGGTILLVLFFGAIIGFLGLFGFWIFGQFRG